MRSWSTLFLGLLLSLLGLVSALSSAGSRLLVLSDNAAEDQTKYSKFLSDLKDRKFKISYASPKDQPKLFDLGERSYDHLLILPTSLKALGPTLTPQTILSFAQQDGNILLALSPDKPTPTSLVSLLLELDIHLPPARDSLVVDHFNYDTISASEKHDVVLVTPSGSKRADVKNYFGTSGPVAFPRIVGQTLGNDSPLLSSIVAAPRTAYSYDPQDEAAGVDDPFAVGSQLHLVSALQARNAARVTVLGSAEALSDKWFDASVQGVGKGEKKGKTANREFAVKLSGWAFKELGVIKATDLKHHLAESTGARGSNSTAVSDVVASLDDLNPKIYCIKNDVTYSVTISEWATDRWVPYVHPTTDALQLEFSMLSPYERLALPATRTTSNGTVHGATFTLPDQHGIFNFRLNYKRPFLTPVDEKRTVTVRHFAHDEWPRSFVIVAAYPWIVGIAVVVAGWFAFVVFWLYSAPTEQEMSGPRGKKVN